MISQQIQNNLDKIFKSCLIIDIETASFFSDGTPINIKTNFENYVNNAKVKWFGAYSFKHNNGFYLNAQEDFQQIINLFNEHDVIIGFNSSEFDFPILVNNGFINEQKRYIQVDCMEILGTSSFRNRKGYSLKNRGELMDYQFKNNSLKCMAETMKLDHQKGEIDFHIFQKDEWTNEEILEIKKYLYSDIMVTKQMFERLWNYWFPFVELLPEKSIYDLSWIKSSIASLTYKSACNVLNTEPTYSEKKSEEESMGGHVFEPKIEEAWGVWYVDFGSLYPHVEAMFNLCAEVNGNDYKEGDKRCWHGNELFQVKGYYDISKWHPLSSYIASKLKERIYLKEHDKDNPMVYTLKILLNSFYGVMRSSIFEKVHTPNVGWDTCWLSRQIQQLTTEMLEQFGFKIIYGDTDSVLFLTDNKELNTKEYVSDCLNQIVEIIKDSSPFPIDTFKLNIEHYLDYILFPFEEAPIVGEDGKNKKENGKLIKERKGKKKNYLYIFTNSKGEKEIKLVGLPIKKDNSTQLGMKIYEEVLKPEILKNNRAKFSASFIENTINEYLKKPEIMELLSQEYKVNAFSSYKLPGQIQAQISKGYFGGEEGVIRLIKNTKVGKAGKGMLYCTVQEATEAKLTASEIDLEKVNQELSPFVEYVESIEKDPILKIVQETIVEECTAKAYKIIDELKGKEPIKKRGRGRPRKVNNA